VSSVEYAGGKRSLQAYIAVCLQIHCDSSSFICRQSDNAIISTHFYLCDIVVLCRYNWTRRCQRERADKRERWSREQLHCLGLRGGTRRLPEFFAGRSHSASRQCMSRTCYVRQWCSNCAVTLKSLNRKHHFEIMKVITIFQNYCFY